MDNFKGVRQMPPTFFETSSFKTLLSMRLSLPIEFIVSLCNLSQVQQCITVIGPVFTLKLTSRQIPISRHVVVHVRVRCHFEGSHKAFLAFVGMLAQSKACYLNSICTKRSKFNVMKVVSAIHVYFASACNCLAEVIPKVSDKCRRPTNAADTLGLNSRMAVHSGCKVNRRFGVKSATFRWRFFYILFCYLLKVILCSFHKHHSACLAYLAS